MRGKKTLNYLINIDFLKKYINDFKLDYKNLLFYLNKHNQPNSEFNKEDLIYNINTYSYYKGVKGQANLFVLDKNKYYDTGFVNSFDFSRVLATEFNGDIYYLLKKSDKQIYLLKNSKYYTDINTKININEFSLFYLLKFFEFDILAINKLIDCLDFLSENKPNILNIFLKKLIDFV